MLCVCGMSVVDSALKPSKCTVYQLIDQAGVITPSSVGAFLSFHCVCVCRSVCP